MKRFFNLKIISFLLIFLCISGWTFAEEGNKEWLISKFNELDLAINNGNVETVINCTISNEFKERLDKIWQKRKQYFINSMETRLQKGNIYVIYDIQTLTNNLLRYAYYCQDYTMLNDLIEVYSIAYNYLKIDTDGYSKWILTDPESTTAKESPQLLGKEVQLCSCQFLYLTSSVVNMVSALDKNYRTAEMLEFVNKFTSLAIQEHYLRWVTDYTIINYNVVIDSNTIIGSNCYIKSGSVIGEDGFGFDFESDGTPVRIPHLGKVVIGDNVEVGAKCTIDRGTLNDTIIEDNVKIDDHVHIAHNCILGKNTIVQTSTSRFVWRIEVVDSQQVTPSRA